MGFGLNMARQANERLMKDSFQLMTSKDVNVGDPFPCRAVELDYRAAEEAIGAQLVSETAYSISYPKTIEAAITASSRGTITFEDGQTVKVFVVRPHKPASRQTAKMMIAKTG